MNATFALRGSSQVDQVKQRVVLYKNELYRVPATYHKVRVVTGTALVTQAARDFVLSSGNEALLERNGDVALISSLRCEQVILEVY
jgi:hypothetical protein